jgi:hypothetical protein
MPRPLPTPYDGSSKLFQIGLKPVGEDQWIDADDQLPAYLAEKERLTASHPGTFLAEPDTVPAQAEVLALLAKYLPARFPDIYRRDGAAIDIVPADRRVRLDAAEPPLMTAAKLVQEDLVLMRRGDAAWRIAAASLHFPSSWNLAEKFGRPIHEVHGPVPGFGAGTRGAELIARMFDSMRPGVIGLRWNWSIYGDNRLYHPESADPTRRRFGDSERAENMFMRVERQTLRRLPESGDILFSIRIHIDPLASLEAQPGAPRIAAALAEQLLALDPDQLAYKGMTLERDRLVARLREISER